MKKNIFLYVLMMVFSISFFSCGDDDDPKPTPDPDPDPKPIETTWKDGKGTFGFDALTYNGTTAPGGVFVTLDESGDNAKITLTNALPEAADVVFDGVAMTKSGTDYTFSSTTTVATTEIAISGTLSGIPATKADDIKLDVTVTRKVTSSIIGDWKLNFTGIAGGILAGDVFFQAISESHPTLAIKYGTMGPTLGAFMSAKVSAVTITFEEDGTFDVNWTKQGENEPTVIDPIIKNMLNIQYFATDEQLFLAFDKTLLELLSNPAIAGMLPEAIKGIDFEALTDLLVDQGRYYALPLIMYLEEGDAASFYMNKEMIGTFLPTIQGLLSVIPIEDPVMATMIPQIFKELGEDMPNCETFDVGLNFIR